MLPWPPCRTTRRRMNFALLAGLLAGTAPAAALQAQDAPPAIVEPEIIVRGEAELETDELRDAVGDIAMRGRDYKRPMARYQAPLCPMVIGMGETMGAKISQRIRSIALESGMEVAEEGCTANALMIVTDDTEKLIEQMRKNHPGLFNARISREIKAARNRGDGAIVWSTYMMQGPQGRGKASGTVFTNSLEGAFANAGGAAQEMRLTFSSKSHIPYSVDKTSTILVFDIDRLDGMHLHQLSDFATMRILGSPQPSIEFEEEAAMSILTLFDTEPTEAPMEMTALDRAYLRGLYAMEPNDPSTRLEHYVRRAYDLMRPALAEDRAPVPEPAAATGEP